VKKPYEIEHIWADHYERHRDEFENAGDFTDYRNRIGGLLLVPQGFNQSYNDLKYTDKLPHYLEQNLLARSLHSQAYERNPGFTRFISESGLPFEPFPEFKKEQMEYRTTLYKQICELIWNTKRLSEIVQHD